MSNTCESRSSVRRRPPCASATKRPSSWGPLKTTDSPSGDHAADDSSPAPIRLETPVASVATVRPSRERRTLRPSGDTSDSPYPNPCPKGSAAPAASTRRWLLPSGPIEYRAQSPSRSLRNRMFDGREDMWPQPAAPSANNTTTSNTRRKRTLNKDRKVALMSTKQVASWPSLQGFPLLAGTLRSCSK